ncbi:hypothetical protein [Streptacidiphilus neutrinimicus]|uniref:hypothetical protein n=1 Tax=Streptacidiphilus neutrinimicus TaxID=105420 RepID=UPI0007C7FC2F|nr:hypothetical protein [Streptacidiphilus neutrinimicus]
MVTQAEHPGFSPLLKIYLNDHLAGATAGVELLRRAARTHAGDTMGPTLAKLGAEVEQDRATLVNLMRAAGVAPQRGKAAAGWLAEKAGRLKFNGRLLSRSPLSDVWELELMRLGVEGKTSCWRTLRALAETDGRLDGAQLDGLIKRATRQAQTLEALRTSSTVTTFTEGRGARPREEVTLPPGVRITPDPGGGRVC